VVEKVMVRRGKIPTVLVIFFDRFGGGRWDNTRIGRSEGFFQCGDGGIGE
jgi:hypothetical protein